MGGASLVGLRGQTRPGERSRWWKAAVFISTDDWRVHRGEFRFDTVSRRGISNEPRAVAIYLLRRLRGDRLDEIGKEFRMAKYSSVSSVIQRMKSEISRNRKLRKRVEQLEEELKMSQEQI